MKPIQKILTDLVQHIKNEEPTDDYSEPKKINILRSIRGTDPRGFIGTKLINDAQNLTFNSQSGWELDIAEDHITVIKKSPKHPLVLQPETFRDTSKNYAGIIKISDILANPNSILNSSSTYFILSIRLYGNIYFL